MNPQTALHNVIVLGIKATRLVVSFDPFTQHRLSTVNLVSNFDRRLESHSIPRGNNDLRLRSKTYHAKIESPLHRFTHFQGANDTSGNQSGNLTYEDGDTRGAS